jgi:hypothetical protein
VKKIIIGIPSCLNYREILRLLYHIHNFINVAAGRGQETHGLHYNE